MKAAIYNPYLDTLGGGERYTLTFAKVLAEIGYDVDIEWKEKSILDKLSKRFGLKFPSNLKIVDSVNRGENYNLIFWVSDGSIPTLRAIKNYIHFQFPFHDVNGSSLLNKMKLFRVNKIICNSKFTKNVIDKEYKVDSTVLYPPVGTDIYKPKRKINQLCYVARFSNLTQNKGHDVLIKQFKKLVKEKKFQDWKLVLAGGVEVGSDVNLKNLKKLASGANIEFVESPSLEVLKDIFGKSKIFWLISLTEFFSIIVILFPLLKNIFEGFLLIKEYLANLPMPSTDSSRKLKESFSLILRYAKTGVSKSAVIIS